jgi:hypothetical protein
MERNRSQLNYDTYSPDGTDDVTVDDVVVVVVVVVDVVVVVKTVS